MGEMHENGVFHGDIKTGNTAIDAGTLGVKFLDFGTACSEKLACKPQWNETPGLYMPPEMIKKVGNGTVDMAKADVYSLGVVFADIYGTGNEWFAGRDSDYWDSSQIRDAQRYINDKVAAASIDHSGIKSLVKDMAQVDPSKRPTISQVMQRLEKMDAKPAYPVAA